MDKTTDDQGKESGSATILNRLLSVYGADRSRWPSDERTRIEADLAGQGAESAALRATLREARALDRLLAHAPLVSGLKADALTARIMQAVTAEVVGDPAAANRVVPFVRGPAKPGLATNKALVMAPVRRPGFATWSAAALLAASLVVGIFTGDSIPFAATLQEIADATGLGPYVDQLVVAADDSISASDEDVL